MKKAYRIKKESDFKKIMLEKKSFANRNFIVYISQTKHPHWRIGLSVGKKVGNAVMRNYIKRQIRESVLGLEGQMRQDYDIIIIARPNVIKLSFAEVQANLTHVFNLAAILD